jgi:hypothetical protein
MLHIKGYKLFESKVESRDFTKEEEEYIWECFVSSFEDLIDVVNKKEVFMSGFGYTKSGVPGVTHVVAIIIKSTIDDSKNFKHIFENEFSPRMKQENYLPRIIKSALYNNAVEILIEKDIQI